MTDSGQVERVTVSCCRKCGKPQLSATCCGQLSSVPRKVRTFVPESDHYSEIERSAQEFREAARNDRARLIERLAGELEAREDALEKLIWLLDRAQSEGLLDSTLSMSLSDWVKERLRAARDDARARFNLTARYSKAPPASLTRGEGEPEDVAQVREVAARGDFDHLTPLAHPNTPRAEPRADRRESSDA